jgi:hypothetical protein
MNWRFWEKKTPSTLEELYEKHLKLQFRQSKFEKQYYDVAAKLEKKRKPGEYIR